MFTHCVWAAPVLFRDDVDRLTFLRHLARTTSAIGWTCIGFCLMDTHHHLVVEVGDGVLPKGMHALNLGYARDFNRRHALRGHVQSHRYGSTRIHSDSQLLTAFAYVANNPAKAGMAASACNWPWSSYAATVGLTAPHSFVDASRVIGCFDGARELAIARLRAFVEKT